MCKRYISKCFFCKQKKRGVEWCFAGRHGCKDCADKYMADMLRRYK